MTRSYKALGLFLLLLASVCVAVAAPEEGDEIWTGVLLATNEASPRPTPRWLAPYSGKLQKMLGYNQFEVIGRNVERMRDSDGQWLIPTKQFYLEVKTESGRGGVYLLHFTLWHEKKMLLETKAKVMPGSPLFVRGPQYGRGQVVFVVEVR